MRTRFPTRFLSQISLTSGLLLSVIGVSPVAAEERTLSGEVVVSGLSDYMFRGLNLYDGLSLQPAATVNYDTEFGRFGANLWAHLSLDGDENVSSFTELDETLFYEVAIEEFTVRVGHVWYTYPDNDDDIASTAEFFASVVFDDSEINPFLSLSPTLAVYHDWDEYEAQYYDLSFSHSFNPDWFGGDVSLTPNVAFGFASDSELVYEDDGLVFTNVGLKASIPYSSVALVPTVNYSFEADENAVNEFWGGMTVVYGF